MASRRDVRAGRKRPARTGGPGEPAEPGVPAGRAAGASTGPEAGPEAGPRVGPGAGPADRGALARDQCIKLLAVRPRTRAELDTALRRRGFDDDVIAEVLDRYSDVGMINDEAFARAWVTSRHHSKGLARRALAGELRRKGVSDDDLGTALDELDGDTEVETARALVERRLRVERAAAQRSAARRAASAKHQGPNEDSVDDLRQREQAAVMRKLVGMLARKGYPPGLAFRVVKEAMDGDAADLLEPDSFVEDLDDFDQLRS
jgi:regulatory protein